VQFMMALLDHSAGFQVLRDEVHVIHVMHVGTQVRVCPLMTERELGLNRSLATVPTHRGHERCHGK
jgi:hypothetical protein